MKKWLLLLFVCITSNSWAARRPYQPSYFTLGAGVFDCGREKYRTFQGLMEFRWSVPPYCLNPLVGVMGTGKGSIFAYMGFGFDIPLGKKWVLIPSFAPGYYHQGQGKNLGFNLEFKSSLELNYILPNQGRLGLQVYHISNASLGKRNPGEESITLNYSIPLKF